MSEPTDDYDAWSERQEKTTVTVDGHDLEMAYLDSAARSAAEQSSGSDPRDDGPENGDGDDPVVFVHGIPTNSFLWRRVAPAIAEQRRVIVPDMVGYGNSTMAEGFDRSIRAQEQAISGLVSALDLGTISLVAHDIGGGVALRYAAHEPENVGRIVVSNGTCYDSWPVPFISNLGLPNTAEMDTEEFEGKLQYALGEGTYGEADPTFVSGMKAPWLREGGQRALARAAVSTNTNHTVEIPYGEITAELLCLWGADDVLQPIEYGEHLVEEVGGEVVSLDEAFHWVTEDRPDAYREELQAFLSAD